jgi:hypothetical protein
VSVHVSVTVEVRRPKARIHHSIDLGSALLLCVFGLDKAEAGARDQDRQGIELTGFGPCQRRGDSEGPAGRQVEVKAE